MAESGARRKEQAANVKMNGHAVNLTNETGFSLSNDRKFVGGDSSGNRSKKRERRHIYHDILPLKVEPVGGSACNSNHHNQENINEELKTCNMPSAMSHHEPDCLLVKPAIPPKPKYILRDKKVRHVYQSIDVIATSKSVTASPPPLPCKPPRLQRNKGKNADSPPPLPPRVVNEDAIRQRHKLDKEYFENLRKSVDDELLGLAEEHDLPVPLNAPNTQNMQLQRFDYGAHSPPLNLNNARLHPYDTTARRHSLPVYESISDENTDGVQEFASRAYFDDPNREMGTYNEIESSQVNLAKNFQLLKRCGWYWGNMTWQEAEELLSKRDGDGAFLMRDSQDPRHLLTLTVRSTTETLHHVRVEYSEGKFQLYEPGRTVSQSTAQCVRHQNIEQFINLAVKHSVSGSFLYFLKPKNMGEPPVQIRFLSPVSRLARVKSLKYLCRMTIRECVVADLISNMQVPPRIQQYLKAGPYYDRNEEMDVGYGPLEVNFDNE